jgi:hypothetical protein
MRNQVNGSANGSVLPWRQRPVPSVGPRLRSTAWELLPGARLRSVTPSMPGSRSTRLTRTRSTGFRGYRGYRGYLERTIKPAPGQVPIATLRHWSGSTHTFAGAEPVAAVSRSWSTDSKSRMSAARSVTEGLRRRSAPRPAAESPMAVSAVRQIHWIIRVRSPRPASGMDHHQPGGRCEEAEGAHPGSLTPQRATPLAWSPRPGNKMRIGAC